MLQNVMYVTTKPGKKESQKCSMPQLFGAGNNYSLQLWNNDLYHFLV